MVFCIEFSIILSIHLQIKILPSFFTDSWFLQSLKYLSGYSLRLFESRGLLETSPKFWIFRFTSLLLSFPSTLYQRRFTWPNHYQSELILLFRHIGHPQSHSEWEDRTPFSKKMEGLEHKMLPLLMKQIHSTYSSTLFNCRKLKNSLFNWFYTYIQYYESEFVSESNQLYYITCPYQ